MGARLRRCGYAVFLCALVAALSWHALLSVCIREAVFWRFGCALSFQGLSIANGSLVLSDAHLVKNQDFDLSVQSVQIGLSLKKPVAILLTRPHLVFPNGIPDRMVQSGEASGRVRIEVSDGTYEVGGANPLLGSFAYRDKRLFVEGGDGSLSIAKSEERLECALERFPLAPFAHLLTFPDLQPVDGVLSGFVHVAEDRAFLRLSLENGGWLSDRWAAAGGVGRLEVEGEVDPGLQSVRRIKVRLQDACAVRKSSRIEALSGILFYNEGIGLRWELDGRDFSWHGKNFKDKWLQSRLRIGKASATLDMEQGGEERLWSLALDAADAPFFQWISDFGPQVDWPYRFAGGELQGKLLCVEQEGRIVKWRATAVEGTNLALIAPGGEIGCRRFSAAAGCKDNQRMSVDGSVQLEGGSLLFAGGAVADLHANLTVSEGLIREGTAHAVCNGLESAAVFSGSLEEVGAEVRVRGPWINFGRCAGLNLPVMNPVEALFSLKGDWKEFRVAACMSFSGEESLVGSARVKDLKVCEAALQANRFDLSRLDASWFGATDLSLQVADRKWSGKALGEDLFFKWKDAFVWIPTLKAQGEYVEGRLFASTEALEGEAAFLGEAVPFNGSLSLEDRLLTVRLEKADAAGIDLAGEAFFSLEKDIPFAFESSRFQGDLGGAAEFASLSLAGKISNGSFSLDGSLLQDPMSWNWALDGFFSEIAHGAIRGAEANVSLDSKVGLRSLSDLQGDVQIGEAEFPIRGFALYREGDWEFDVKLEDRFRDLARLAGSAFSDAAHVSFQFDPDKSHLLGVRLQVQECKAGADRLETLKLAAKISSEELRSWKRSLQAIDRRIGSLLDAPFEGTFAAEADLRANALSLVRIGGEEVTWKGKNLALHLALLQNGGKWKVEALQVGGATGEASFFRTEEGWQIEGGVLRLQDGAEAAVVGWISPDLQCELSIESLSLPLDKMGVLGEVEGKGSANFDWREDFRFETDLDLSLSSLAMDGFRIENKRPLQLHFSKRQGLLVRGLDLEVRKTDCDISPLSVRIGLMQVDLAEKEWRLHHSHLRLPTDSFSFFLQKLDPAHPVAGLLRALDSKSDLECFAEISFAEDLSRISCFMKEGFIPFFGAVRHLQNVDFRYEGNAVNLDFLALHQGHSLKIGSLVQIDKLSGLLTLEDEGRPPEEGERAMAVQWGIDSKKGFVIHSVEGAFGGIEAAFHEEVGEQSSLIGSAKLDCGYLSEILSPRISRVFNELKMGKGYELKGRLSYGSGLKGVEFKGLLSGKNCELCGWQIRSLLSQIEIGASLVRLFELKGSDAAGILKIDRLNMSQKEDEPWKIAMPSFKLLEFRPSLLQKVGRDVGPVGPLVIRELEMKDFRGELEESLTYTAKGTLSFINSFKREHTVFDLPADVLGRIFGLDLELLIPVKGNLTFALKEGKFWLDDLQGAYSEGKRSKFFLVKEGASPTIDLDGNVNILVKMKQYVLFKFTENFLLSIDGTLGSPSYSLQKKSRIQKLLGL